MKKIIIVLSYCLLVKLSFGQLILDDEKFKVDKNVVAQVKEFKLGFLLGRETRLINSKEEALMTFSTKTYNTLQTGYTNYINIFVPSINDSIQMYNADFEILVNYKGYKGIQEKHWATFVNINNLLNLDGSLNIENVKATKFKYPFQVIKEINEKNAYTTLCANQLKTPTNRDRNTKVVLKEKNRNLIFDTTSITYTVEHNNTLIGEITARGLTTFVANERSEIDYKVKFLPKRTDIPLSYKFKNTSGCEIAFYDGATKKLYTLRAGEWFNVLKQIIKDNKEDLIKTRIEYISTMADHLISLGFY